MKKIFLTFLMLIFTILPISLTSNISVSASSNNIPNPNSNYKILGKNFIDPANFEIVDGNYWFILTNKYLLEHDETYTFYFAYKKNDIFTDNNIDSVTVYFYDENLELIEGDARSDNTWILDESDYKVYLYSQQWLSNYNFKYIQIEIYLKKDISKTDYLNLLDSNYFYFSDKMIDNVNDFIGIFSNDSDEIITYFPKSLQLLDLENWFYYRARDLGTFSRKITLTQRFILDSNKEYTLVLNKSIFSHYPIDANVDDTIEEFYILQKFETIDYFIYVLHPIYDDIIINDRWYQIIDNFEFEFESRNDATLEPNILADELSQLMILHEGLPKDSYTLEDFKYKHPLDDTSPVFEGDTYFVTNVSNPFSLEQILSHIVVWDDEDGFIDPVVVEDNYSANKDILGSYTIKLEATDKSGNSSQLVIIVMVVDREAPEIIGPNNFDVPNTKRLTVEEIKSKYQVIDNYDSELSLSIIEDEYQANWNKVGNYKVVLKAVDSSGNEAIKQIKIYVIDVVPPTISGPTNIVKNKNDVLTMSDIKAMFLVTDDVDGDITHELYVIEDTYTGNAHKVGVYKIVFGVEDSWQNESRHEVTIRVLDNIPPVFYIDNYLINVQSGVALTEQQIVDLLVATGQLNVNGVTYVNFILNEYKGNEDVVGVYNLKLSAVSTDGSEKTFDLQVKVLEVEDNINPIIVEAKNFFEKVWNHILSNWYWYLLGLIVLILILKTTRFRYRRY